MVIGIESVYGDKRLVGKTMSLDELKNAVKEILGKHEAKNLFPCFAQDLDIKKCRIMMVMQLI